MAAEPSGLQGALHITARVQPGNRIEITAPELTEGESVEVFVVLPRKAAPRRSALEVIESLKGHRLFRSPEEVDRYLKEERDSWER